jgi:hypothetical protein
MPQSNRSPEGLGITALQRIAEPLNRPDSVNRTRRLDGETPTVVCESLRHAI